MYTILAFLALPLLVTAQIDPTSPGPGDTFKEGAQCTIEWNTDPTGQWKQTYIELMTGSNSPMVHLTTVGVVDGTDATKTSFAYPCPAVSPNSAIYFYQFTALNQRNVTWTGRFAISDPSGATTPPQNAKQPNGENVPWGTGELVGLKGTPPPPTAPPGQIDGSGSSGNATAVSSAPASNSAPSPSGTPSFVAAPTSLSSNPSPATPSAVGGPQPSTITSTSGVVAIGNTAFHHGLSLATAIAFILTLDAFGLY